MKIYNPATGEILSHLMEDTPLRIEERFESAREAQFKWARKRLKDRIAMLASFSALLEENIESLAQTLTDEVGKPLQQSRNEIKGAQKRIDFFLAKSEKWLTPEWAWQEEGLGEKIVYEPLGVVGNISAWNYPYLVGVNVFVPALIAGNSVLYKPSEYATLTGLQIEDLLHQAGVPENVFQTVIGGKEAGETLLRLPLDGYFFTGSYKTGRYIYEQVSSKLVPCQLELGGKDPLYVTADNKDIKAVAAAAADGAFYNNGQSCCAVERIYVHESVHDAFVKAFIKEVNAMKVGNPNEEGVYIGPLTRESQLDLLENQVKDAKHQGGILLSGGKRIERPGYYFQPTVFVNVNHGMLLMREESFGPIIGIQKVEDDMEAVHWMLDTPYGLTASVYSDHYEHAKDILEAMDSGTVYWNCCDRVSANLPWSGRGFSGIGSTLSYQGIRAFVKPKAYHLRGEYADKKTK